LFLIEQTAVRSELKKVLIAHQSSVPHYRVPFYNSLERLKPKWWRFDVAFDRSEIETKRFFAEQLKLEDFNFSILDVNTLALKLSDKTISYQTFWAKAGSYDLVIVENAVNNLAYCLSQLHQLHGVRFAYWGHGKDRTVDHLNLPKLLSEKLKLSLVRKAHGFFAYTDGVKAFLAGRGVPVSRIFTLNNTIDINHQRQFFLKCLPDRESIKQQFGLTGKKNLLFVGRFTKNKRIDFLLEAFSLLRQQDDSFHLLLVGSGGEVHIPKSKYITYFGSIVDLDKLAPIYVASDVFTFPGSVGLGPLQALCYDLPIVTIESDTHLPEIEYLLPENSIILPRQATPKDYADTLIEIFGDETHLAQLKAGIWPSIRHLTIDNMAQNFINGVNCLLQA
jgi:glycosyltransferase involved in cell wall biosynthesis